MLIKVLGGLVIVVACCCVGFEMSKELSGRVRVLGEMAAALEKMHSLISYSKTPLTELYAELAGDDSMAQRFFMSVEWSEPPRSGWKKAIKQLPYITKSDAQILQRLADNLGRSDSENQLSDIKFAEAEINAALGQAKALEARDSRMYKSVSFFAGIGIAVLLI